MTTIPADTHTIACFGEVTINAAANRLSATIFRGVEVYAVVTSAYEAKDVLTHGVEQYEIFIGPSDFWATNIATMANAVASVLL